MRGHDRRSRRPYSRDGETVSERIGMNGWIGVDLDGTLAHYDGWKGEQHIGEPVPAMAARVRKWLADGLDVRIFTARVAIPDPMGRIKVRKVIDEWTLKYFGQILPVTCRKDYGMIELWDDRAVRVRLNTGEPCCADDAEAP